MPHEFDLHQVVRYFAQAQGDMDGIVAAGSEPVLKAVLAAAFRAWDLAGWTLLAQERRVEFWDLQKSVTREEKDRAVAALMHMPELDRALDTIQEAMRGFADGPSWTYDGGIYVDRPTFNACMGSLRAAFSRARQMIDAGPA